MSRILGVLPTSTTQDRGEGEGTSTIQRGAVQIVAPNPQSFQSSERQIARKLGAMLRKYQD